MYFSILIIFVGIIGFFALLTFIGSASRKRDVPDIPPPPQKQEVHPDEKAGLNSKSGILLGWRDGNPRYYNGDRHLVTFGPTGSGKNATAQTPALLNYDGAALIIDPKGQLCAITARNRSHRDWVRALNPYGLLGIPTATYNPLSHLQPSALTFTADCERIAEGLVNITQGDHWEISALDLVAVLIKWVKLGAVDQDNNPLPKNLISVRKLVNLSEVERIDYFREIIGKCDNPELRESAGRYGSTKGEVQDCFGTAQRELRFLADPAISKLLEGGEHEISFADLKKGKDTYFLIIPPELIKTRGKFLRLIVMSALGELYRATTKPEQPVLFMLDEFAQLGKLSFVEDAASIARDYKIRFWFILQNLPKLRDIYGAGADSILAAAGAVQGLAFTPNDMETAKYFSERSGIKTELKVSLSKSENFGSNSSYSSGGSSGSLSSGSSSGTSYSTSHTETEVPQLKIHDLFALHESYQVLVCPNIAHSLVLGRFPYWKIDSFEGSYEKDPYHMTDEERAKFEFYARRGHWAVNLKPYAEFLESTYMLAERKIREQAGDFKFPYFWPPFCRFDPDRYKPPYVVCCGCGSMLSFWVWNEKSACPECANDNAPKLYSLAEN